MHSEDPQRPGAGTERAGSGMRDWLTLDNAAKIYPAVTTDSLPTVFRMSATLDRPVNLEALQGALDKLMKRFPYYQVHLQRGFFWYYLERHGTPPTVQLLQDSPVSNVSIRTVGGHLFRVSARGSTVAVDYSHVLTDGYGGMQFLATLLAEYYRRLGVAVPAEGYVLEPDDEPDAEEWEDAYKRYVRQGAPAPPKLTAAYHIPHRRWGSRYRAIEARTSVAAARATAKRYNASLTEYLVAVHLDALAAIHDTHRRKIGNRAGRNSRKQIIRIEVPVNMRRIHPSRTTRNFSLFVSPEIDLRMGSYNFDEIVRTVHHQMRHQLDHRQLGRQMARNVGGELSPIVRAIPLVLKDLYLSQLHHSLGPELYSGVVSNLGGVPLPQELMSRVRGLGFVLGPNVVMKKNCSVISWGDTLQLTFGSVIESRELEREFVTRLVAEGLNVAVSEY